MKAGVPKLIPGESGCLVRRLRVSDVQDGWNEWEATYWNAGRAWRMRFDSAAPYGLELLARLVEVCPHHCQEVRP